jgi:DNA-binding transcriptional regulator YbjK
LATPAPRSRRTAIADAAIEILASAGSRGLTHRAVDRRLGIPEGSTSSYYRTREALVKATAARITELDLETTAESVSTGTSRLETAQLIAALVEDAAAPGNRERSLARYALLVEAAGDGELRRLFRKSRGSFLHEAERLLREAGAKHPSRGAPALAVFINGLVLSRITNLEDTMIGSDELVYLIERFLSAY